MLGDVPEGEISLHQCSLCDKSFKQERALRIHRHMTHTNPRRANMTHTIPTTTLLTHTKRKRRRKTSSAKDTEGQEASEKITSKPRNTRIITFSHSTDLQNNSAHFDISGAGGTSFGILCHTWRLQNMNHM